MCGILGTINRPFGGDILDLISHRGPDDSAISKSVVGGHAVTLGHRRLSILDLSPAGHQPMWTEGAKHGIVFNGEIYNHLDLRSRIPSIDYRGHSDTETILHYLALHGASSAAEFNGIFAFGFVDAPNRKLYLVRDPFGIKPLYYCADGQSFLFASELRPLQAMVDDSLDVSSLAELLRLRYLPSPDTLFKNIRKVRPGHVIEVDLSGLRLSFREYPFLAPAPAEISPRNSAEVVEQYGFLLEQAVKRQLLSDVQIGVLLSGGIDSAVIASIAQKHAGYRMKSFTVGFTGEDAADETAEARETATLIGLDHHEVRIGFPEFLDVLQHISAIVEEPLATTSVVPMFHLSSLTSKHVKVALSGQGADEAMGGYRRYQTEILKSFVPRFAVPLLDKAAGLAGIRNDTVRRALDSIGEPDDVRRFETIYSVFDGDRISRLVGRGSTRACARIRYFYDLLKCSSQSNSVQRMMSLDLRMNLADDLLLYTDKITMRHSIECRVPLLDLDLVRFVESLPYRYRVGILRGKLVHKQFAKRILPASIIRRKKKGFFSPTRSWFKDTKVIGDILLDPASRFSSYFDLSEVKKVLLEHSAGINRERQIFLLLSIHYWMSECLGRGIRSDRSATPVKV